MRMKLTKRSVDRATYQGPGADYRWDAEFAGFGLRIYPSGRKSFVVTYRLRGKQRFFTLGRYGTLTLQQARTEAFEVFGRVRKGQDPSAERQLYHEAPTIADMAERHLEEHARVHNKASTVAVVERLWQQVILPRIGLLKVADITREDMVKLNTDLGATPGQANQVRSLLSKSFNLAEIWGWRQEGSNPCRHVKPYKLEKHERFLSPEELGRLSETLCEAERTKMVSGPTIAAFRLLILTGCRRGEILNLRWNEVDFEAKCLRLPDSKTGAKTVPLNSAALRVLASIDRLDNQIYVIRGTRPDSKRSGLSYAWSRICKQAQLEGVRIHDLRHTFASYGVGKGLSLPLVGKLLGHTQIATTERYAHLADDPIRQATESIGAELAAAMSRAPKAEVIALEDHAQTT